MVRISNWIYSINIKIKCKNCKNKYIHDRSLQISWKQQCFICRGQIKYVYLVVQQLARIPGEPWQTLTLTFSRRLIRLVLCDATLLWPIEILALNTSQLAVRLFVLSRVKYLPRSGHTELANCKATVVLAVHSCRLTQVTMQCIHSPAQTTEWNLNQWCGFFSLISNEQIRSIARLTQNQCWVRSLL